MNTIYFDIYENKFEKGDKLKHFVFEIKSVGNKFYEYPFKAVIKTDDTTVNAIKGFVFEKSTLLDFINSKLSIDPIVLKLGELKNDENELIGFLMGVETSVTIYDIMRLIADIACDLFGQLNGILCYDQRFEDNISKIKLRYAKDVLNNRKQKNYYYKFIDFNKYNLSVECYGLLPKMFSVVF